MTEKNSSYYAEIGGDFKGIQGNISGGIINQYIITHKSGSEITSQPLIPGSPYVGLTKFKEKDKDKFFGRDGQISDLTNYLEKNKLLLLMGASGSGKSSLVLAGLIPHLEDKYGSSKFFHLVFDPTADPFKSLDRKIPDEYRDIVGDITPESPEDILIQLVRAINKDYERQLIFIDQFEELFTLTPRDKQASFINCLLRLIEEKNPSVHLVMTMRSDFLGSLSSYPELATVLEQHIRLIKDMTRDELRLAIAEPAARNHVIFEGNLVEIIIDDFLGQAGSLPLLQFTLNLLWEKDKELDGLTDQTLNMKTYQDKDFGGVAGALQIQANRIYENFNADEQKAVQKIFLQLVDIVNEKRVSNPVALKIFEDAEIKKVVNVLIDKRLLVLGVGNDEKESMVQVSHEELLRSWDKLDELFREKEDIILLRRRLESDAKEWDELVKQDPKKANAALILNVPKLQKVVQLYRDGSLSGLDALTKKFIKASYRYQELSQQEKEKRKKREVETELSLANSLSGYSLYLFNQRKELEAFVEAIKAGKILQKHKTSNLKVMDALQTLLVEGREYNSLEGHNSSVKSVNFSPDGQTLVSGSDDSKIKLWDIQTGKEIRTLTGHKHFVRSVNFSPDGKTLVSGSYDETIKLWNVQTGEEIRTLTGHDDSVNSVNFSPDGQTLVSGSGDNTIKLWNVQTGEEIRTLTGHDGSVLSVNFSPDGQTLVSGGDDETIKLWNGSNGWGLDALMARSCDRVRSYLTYNPKVSDSDKHLCDGIGKTAP